MSNLDDEVLFDSPFPSPEALEPYAGKWIGYDDEGTVRVSGETLREAGMSRPVVELADFDQFRVNRRRVPCSLVTHAFQALHVLGVTGLG